MSHLTQKFLSFLLTALLVFAPLQPVSASTEMSASNSMASCHSTPLQGDQVDHHMAHDMSCDQCETSNLCDDNCCSSGPCSTVSPVLTPHLSLVATHGNHVHTTQAFNGKLPRFSDAHFRPPRS